MRTTGPVCRTALHVATSCAALQSRRTCYADSGTSYIESVNVRLPRLDDRGVAEVTLPQPDRVAERMNRVALRNLRATAEGCG
jgi:hypothetical protein